MKIKIKLNIQPVQTVFPDSHENDRSKLWKECWLKTEYIREGNDKFKCYLYPCDWGVDAKEWGFAIYTTHLENLNLKEWIKECEHHLNSYSL